MRLLRKYKTSSPFFSPQGESVQGKNKGPLETEKLALFGALAQGTQRSDVRLAFLHDVGVNDRRAEVEFELGM